jgi:hypothetical protein
MDYKVCVRSEFKLLRTRPVDSSYEHGNES